MIALSMIPTKTKIAVLVGTLVVIALILQSVRIDRLQKLYTTAKTEREQAIKFVTAGKSQLAQYKNSNGILINKTELLELTLSNTQKLADTERLRYLKEFDKLKKDLRNLQNAGSFEWMLVEDSIPFTEVVIPCKDSIKLFHYNLLDEFNHISAMVLDTPKVEIRVPFYTTLLWERRHKFLWWRVGKKEYSVESYTPNKLVKVTKQELISVNKK